MTTSRAVAPVAAAPPVAGVRWVTTVRPAMAARPAAAAVPALEVRRAAAGRADPLAARAPRGRLPWTAEEAQEPAGPRDRAAERPAPRAAPRAPPAAQGGPAAQGPEARPT